MNETLSCYDLNESPLVELLLIAIYFSLEISLKRNLETLRVFPFLLSSVESVDEILCYHSNETSLAVLIAWFYLFLGILHC